VTPSVVISIECVCSEHGDIAEMTPIMNSVHTSNDSLQERRVQLSVVSRKESYCSEQGDMTELTLILNSVHTYNDSLKRTRATKRCHYHRK
jgi:hypothetical protein